MSRAMARDAPVSDYEPRPSDVKAVADAGADTFVAGSAIFGAKDYAATIAAMREQIAQAG